MEKFLAQVLEKIQIQLREAHPDYHHNMGIRNNNNNQIRSRTVDILYIDGNDKPYTI
ncbi:hypothetical protein [Sporomusa carbonis]|uniref:hypothetical protein n=1 Tax=Sporomusa carbonis TaxID=3076075 RepID=UPI003C7AAB0E